MKLNLETGRLHLFQRRLADLHRSHDLVNGVQLIHITVTEIGLHNGSFGSDAAPTATQRKGQETGDKKQRESAHTRLHKIIFQNQKTKDKYSRKIGRKQALKFIKFKSYKVFKVIAPPA